MPAATMQTLDGVVIGDAPLIRVRGLVNRFGDQLVHDGVDLDVRRADRSAQAQRGSRLHRGHRYRQLLGEGSL